MSGLRVGIGSAFGREAAAPHDSSQDIVSILLAAPALRGTLTASDRAELQSLTAESDSQSLFEALLGFAGRLEQADRVEAAVVVYSRIVGADLVATLPDGGRTPGSALQQRAQQRLDAILGRGAAGARAEFLLRRLAREAASPSMLVGMAGAQAVFGLTRVALLSRLAASPTASFLTRGFGARTVASLGAFALEAPSFVAFTRGANAALGVEQDWSLATLGREVAGSYITLGALKSMGALVNPLTGQATRLTGLSAVSQRLLPQAAMFGGIVAGHELETRVGLRDRVDGATTLVDSLAMLLQFHVGGRLMGHALPHVEALNRELNIRSEAIERLPSSGDGTASGLLGLPQPVLSVSGGLEPRRLGTQSAASMLPERWLSVDAPGSKRPPPVAPGATDPAETVRVEAKGAPATELPATCRCLIVTFHHEGGLNGGRPPRELLQLLARLRSGFARNPGLEEARVRFSDGSVLFLHREEDGTLTESREHGPQAEALESFNAYPDTAVQRSEAVAAWQPRPLTTPLPEFLRELRRQSGLTQLQIAERIREITGEAKDYNAVSRYERNAEAGIPFRVLRALGDIYGVGIRTLIQISNQTRFPGIPAAQWTTRYHPIYLENSGDLDRIDYYRRADRRHESFGWTIYAARKNPFRYRTTVDLETETGLNANAFARLEQNANQPSLRAIRGLSAALNISERELIARANRTFHPELDLEALFPGKNIFLDPLAEDVRKVREYAAAPGSLGQTLFAYRKSLPDLPGAVEMSLRLDRHENYWGERELNRVSPDASNWRDWYDLFRKLDLPLDPIHPFLGPAARTEDSPAALFQEALTGETLSGFVARTGFDKKGLSLILGSRHREVQSETILDLQNALPGLNGARFYRALRPELLQFFPESGHNPPHLEVSREQIAEAMALHLGEALYAHRMANGIGLDALASQLGVSDATLKNYESISVQIENPEVLARAARILNLDPKVVYLHYHPQILRLFPIPPLQGRVFAPLSVAEYRYWTQERASIRDRGNMREALYQEANQVGISDPEALARRLGVSLPVAKKYWQKISILTVGEIQTLTRAFPGLSYRDWYEHFQAYALNYFLGRNLDGSVDYSLPEGWTLERLRGWDLRSAVRAAVDARFTSPREAAAATGVGFLARNENLVRGIKERSWTNDTIAQVARGLGMDRRLLFLYFRHPDLPPMRAMQP